MHLKVLLASFLFFAATPVLAQVIDPEKHIQKYGYNEKEMNKNGMYSYRHMGGASPETMTKLKTGIAKLPKEASVRKTCDAILKQDMERVAEEQRLAKQQNTVDLSLIDYGSNEATIACVLKAKRKNEVSTELLYVKLGSNAVFYVVIVPN